MTGARPFRPPPGLRNRHVQTMLSSGPLRRWLVLARCRRVRHAATPVVLDAGNGVRLTARHNLQQHLPEALGLVVIVHGWEGNSGSNYVLESATQALAEGWDVVRLNLRDHGGSQALNRDFFHSCRLDETVGALAAIGARWPAPRLALAGFSLGGNFALRMALRAPAAGIELAGVLAVCPVINPERNMRAIEASKNFYHRYFMHKWRRSLRIKQRLFAESVALEQSELKQGLSALTRTLVMRHSGFANLEEYLDGYTLSGARLAGLSVPARILTSRDDPIIPVVDVEPLAAIDGITVDITEYGGHCGFIDSYALRSWTARYLGDWLGGGARE